MNTQQMILSLFFLLFFTSCGGTKKEIEQISRDDARVIRVAEQGKCGTLKSPVTLNHRKLSLQEIAAHLDMDTATAQKHLKATNIHGYYSLIAKNYPPGTTFTLYQKNNQGDVHEVNTFTANDQGFLMARLDELTVAIDHNYLFFSNYLPGEPSDFILIQKKGPYSATTRIIPNAIEGKDIAGRQISVEMDGADKRHYLIHCCGLQPFGSYHLQIQFESEVLTYTIEADVKGEIVQQTAPTVAWVKGGEGRAELSGRGMGSPITVFFSWGE